MLREFVIENLGRLRRAVSPPNLQCGRLTLIFAPNGYGKTTFSTALRAAEAGDTNAIRGRRSLGNGNREPRVVFTFENGVATYENGAWDATRPCLSIFDGNFIAENVHAAEVVSLDMRRSMFSVVLGREGIALYEQERQAVAQATAAQQEEANARAALRDDLPPGMNADQFLAAQPMADIADRIEQGGRRVASARQAANLQQLRLPAPLPPVLPVVDLFETLEATLPAPGPDAEAKLSAHQERFGFDEKGERWLMYGAHHIVDEACPFCGRDDVDAEGLASIYRTLFSEQYLAMTRRIAALSSAVDEGIGQRQAQALQAAHTANLATIEPWRPYCDLGPAPLPERPVALEALATAAQLAANWITRKQSSPALAVDVAAERQAYETALASATDAIDRYNQQVEALRATMIGRRDNAARDDLNRATQDLLSLQKLQRRTDPGVGQRCERLRLAIEAKRAADRHKDQVRNELRQAVQARTVGFVEAVNGYLRDFEASFEIEDVRHTFPGGVGSTGYALRIREEMVPVTHGEVQDAPCFKNTLSTGDKTTLALAFFLARLETERDLGNRTVVFDDPFSSHDRFRQSRTVESIRRLVTRCAQVIVLSHDELFLRKVGIACANLPRAVYQLRLDHDRWAVIEAGDLDDLGILGQEQRIRDIRAFVDRDEGDEGNIARMLRQTLEHRYRHAFPRYFRATERLGGICQKIEEGGAQHECAADLEDLQMVNRETRGQHHAEDRARAEEPNWDRDNLRAIARTTLRLARA